LVPTKLVPVETSSKIAAGPLASGDPQVTLSHVDCLPQALTLDMVRPLVVLRGSRGVSTIPLTIITSPEHRIIFFMCFNIDHHQIV
jgi:hypothetical protein